MWAKTENPKKCLNLKEFQNTGKNLKKSERKPWNLNKNPKKSKQKGLWNKKREFEIFRKKSEKPFCRTQKVSKSLQDDIFRFFPKNLKFTFLISKSYILRSPSSLSLHCQKAESGNTRLDVDILLGLSIQGSSEVIQEKYYISGKILGEGLTIIWFNRTF